LKSTCALVIFFFFALRPAINVGYVLYYELNIDYIVETYCVNTDKPALQCNGKCFLSKQLTLDVDQEDPSQGQQLQIVEAFYPLFYQNEDQVDISSTSITFAKENFPNHLGSIKTFQERIDPPPKAY
jgi:hypothetical protein